MRYVRVTLIFVSGRLFGISRTTAPDINSFFGFTSRSKRKILKIELLKLKTSNRTVTFRKDLRWLRKRPRIYHLRMIGAKQSRPGSSNYFGRILYNKDFINCTEGFIQSLSFRLLLDHHISLDIFGSIINEETFIVLRKMIFQTSRVKKTRIYLQKCALALQIVL